MPEPTKPNRGTTLSGFLVERYDPGLTIARLKADEPEVRRAARTLTRAGHPVRYLGSTLIPAEETAFYLFEAEDTQWVEEATRRARVPFDRVVSVVDSREPQRAVRPQRRRVSSRESRAAAGQVSAPKEED